jgi:hypothetical protein
MNGKDLALMLADVADTADALGISVLTLSGHYSRCNHMPVTVTAGIIVDEQKQAVALLDRLDANLDMIEVTENACLRGVIYAVDARPACFPACVHIAAICRDDVKP